MKNAALVLACLAAAGETAPTASTGQYDCWSADGSLGEGQTVTAVAWLLPAEGEIVHEGLQTRAESALRSWLETREGLREELARIVEIAVESRLEQPRDLDGALDAILETLVAELTSAA